jgi:hypothetical protein
MTARSFADSQRMCLRLPLTPTPAQSANALGVRVCEQALLRLVTSDADVLELQACVEAFAAELASEP